MKVFIKNKIFSVGGSSTVKNDKGEDVFFVKGKVMSPTHVKYVCDKEGNKLYKVRNKWFNFFNERAYVFDDENNEIASVKHPFMGGKRFIVEGYKENIYVDGDFFSLTSTIVRDGQPIGTINRQITLFKDAFSLEAEEADMPFLVALVIAIDNIIDKITKS